MASITGRVQAIDGGEIWVRIEQTPPRGAHLKADKGINFPDTRLDLPAVTEEDAEHLAFIAKNADLVGLSFVNHERDVTSLIARLKALTAKPPGIVLKIETRRGFERLPAILLSAMRHSRFAVMIARGDLAVECGYERLAEIQEEMLWICEAAHCPAIWATQVLASLVRRRFGHEQYQGHIAQDNLASMLRRNRTMRVAVRIDLQGCSASARPTLFHRSFRVASINVARIAKISSEPYNSA